MTEQLSIGLTWMNASAAIKLHMEYVRNGINADMHSSPIEMINSGILLFWALGEFRFGKLTKYVKQMHM